MKSCIAIALLLCVAVAFVGAQDSPTDQLNKCKEALSNLSNLDALNTLSGALGGLLKPVVDLLNQIVKTVVDLLTQLITALQGVIDKLPEQLVTPLVAAVCKLVECVVEFVDELTGLPLDSLPKLPV